MTDNLVTVVFLPDAKEISVPRGENLLAAAVSAGLEVNAVCGGRGSCGKCRARVATGKTGDFTVGGGGGQPVRPGCTGVVADWTSVATEAEKKFLTPAQMQAGVVLLCQRSALGNITLELTPGAISPGRDDPVKGDLQASGMTVNPQVVKTFHRLTQPTTLDQTADLQRLLKQLPTGTSVDLELIKELPVLMRTAAYQVTSVVSNGRLIAVEAGDTAPQMYGLALDLGTTSVAGYLADLHTGRLITSVSRTNRQQVYGADVISRIGHTLTHPGGLAEMQELIARTIDEVVTRASEKAGILPERIYLLTLIGNTVMSHLVLDVPPGGLVSAPFVPAFTGRINGTAGELGLKSLLGRTPFILLPNIAGYVGSDTLGVMLATGISNRPGKWLAVDIGTNGEVILSDGKRLLTCSTAAGPAFEGASISYGMRAQAGAIYEVRLIDDVRLKVVGGGEPVGICGSGLIDTVAEMLRLGILKTNGRIKKPGELPPDLPGRIRDRIVPDDKGFKFVLARANRGVAVTQKDISELQLGKGAIRAGIEILMETMNIKAMDLDGIMLAGAFGSNLNPANVRDIGLLPPVELNRIKAVGNAAGLGGLMCLLDKKQMARTLELPKQVEHVELSLNTGFQRKFAQAISFSVK